MREDTPLILARLDFLQPDLLGDVVELLFADGFQLLAARLELFVNLDGLLGHLLMRVFGPADEEEIIALGDALVPVGIQPDAEQRGLAFRFFGVRHAMILDGKIVRSMESLYRLAAGPAILAGIAAKPPD